MNWLRQWPGSASYPPGACGVDLLANARTNVMGSLHLRFSALALPPTWWSSMIADNLGVTSSVLAADVAAMGEALRFPSQVGKVQLTASIGPSAKSVRAHHELLGESMRRFLSGPAMTGAANAIVTSHDDHGGLHWRSPQRDPALTTPSGHGRPTARCRVGAGDGARWRRRAIRRAGPQRRVGRLEAPPTWVAESRAPPDARDATRDT